MKRLFVPMLLVFSLLVPSYAQTPTETPSAEQAAAQLQKENAQLKAALTKATQKPAPTPAQQLENVQKAFQAVKISVVGQACKAEKGKIMATVAGNGTLEVGCQF